MGFHHIVGFQVFSHLNRRQKKTPFLEALPWLPWLSAHRSDKKTLAKEQIQRMLVNPWFSPQSLRWLTENHGPMANLWYAERVDMFFLTKTRTKQTKL